jgi:CBS domain-containing protein
MAVQIRFRTLGDITGTNSTRIHAGTDGSSVAEQLLSSHTSEAPVVDSDGRYVGTVSEMDLLKAFEAGRDLKTIEAEDLMTRKVPAANESMPIQTATRLMEEKNLMNLPVVRDGVLVSTITRHDLLRSLLDAGLGVEQ